MLAHADIDALTNGQRCAVTDICLTSGCVILSFRLGDTIYNLMRFGP